jgi:signal transduction histidine kinase
MLTPNKLFFFFFIMFCEGLSAQNYFIQHLAQSEGLPQNSINKLAFTNEGFLWLATEDGLVRYDGVNFKINNVFNNTYIKNDRFKSIIIDTKDNLLAFNANGHRFLIKENSIEKVNANSSLYNVNGLFPNNLLLQNNLLANNPLHLATVPTHTLTINDSLMIVTKYHSIYLINKNRCIDSIPFKHNQIASFFTWNKNSFLFSQTGIIYKIEINKDKLKLINTTKFFGKFNAPYQVFFKRDKEVFVWHNKTIFCLKYHNKEFILKPLYKNFIDTEIITDIDLEKHKNILAIGTLTNGIYLLKPNYFSYVISNTKTLNHQSGPHCAFVILNDSTIVNSHKQIFVNNKFNRNFTYNNTISHDILDTNKNSIYFTRQNSILSYNFNTNKTSLVRNSLATDITLIQNWGDSMFFADKQFWYLYYKNKIIKIHKHSNQRKQNRINDVILHNSKLYIASSLGLFIHDLLNNTTQEQKINLNIRSINLFDEKLILSTYGNGVVIFCNNKFYPLNLDANGLSSKAHVTLRDSFNRFWIGTNNGLFVINYDDIKAKIKDSSYVVNYTKYDKQNGLLNAEFNGGRRPSALIDKKGNFYFSTMSGILKFNPYLLSSIYKNTPLFSDGFIINDKIITNSNQIIEIARVKNKGLLKINLATTYWFNKDNEILSFQVIGPLSYSGRVSLAEPVINISYLPSGSYEIIVKKLNSFKSDDQLLLIKLNIKKEFYETYLFWIVIIICIIIVVIFVLNLYNTSLINQKKTLENIVAIRTHDIELTNQKLVLSEKELKQTVKLKSKLVSIISHDIVTPLRFMSMVTKNNYATTNDLKEVLDDVHHTTERLYQNAHNILNWIKYQNHKITPLQQPVSPYALTQEISEILQQAFNVNQNQFINQIDPDLIVKTDKTILGIVLHNLIANAVKYIKNGDIIASYSFIDKKHFIEIKDTGQGIPQSILIQIKNILNKNITNIETTEDLNDISNGLGYTIISELSILINLEVNVESIPNNGTIVTISWFE